MTLTSFVLSSGLKIVKPQIVRYITQLFHFDASSTSFSFTVQYFTSAGEYSPPREEGWSLTHEGFKRHFWNTA